MNDQEMRAKLHHAVDTTLSGLNGDPLLAQRVLRRAQAKEEPKMKRKLSVALVLALALALMTVTAVAAGLWNIFDFTARIGATVLDEAADTVQKGIAQQGGETSLATFTLREAVCDSRAAYLVFDVAPADEHTLLVPSDTLLDDNACAIDPSYPEDETVEAWAAANGYTAIVRVHVNTDPATDEKGFTALSLDDLTAENGRTLCLRCEYVSDEDIEAAFTCVAAPIGGEAERAILTASLQVDAPLWTAASSAPTDYPEAGVRIDSLTLTGTVMAMYTDMTFTITDQEAYDSFDDGLWFEFLDETGERIPGGARAEGGIGFVDEEAGVFCYTDSLQAAAQAPAEMVVRAYSAWTKERWEPVTVALGE